MMRWIYADKAPFLKTFVLFAFVFILSFGSSPVFAEDVLPIGSTSFTIRADWFDEGNAISGGIYSDRYICIFNSGTTPNIASYEIDFPVAGTYQVEGLYAADQSRPVKILLNDKLLHQGFATTTGSWQTSSARWEDQGELRIDSPGIHIMTLEALDLSPHICALRFTAESSLPDGWRLNREVARMAMLGLNNPSDLNNGQSQDWDRNPTGHFAVETELAQFERDLLEMTIIDESAAIALSNQTSSVTAPFSFNDELTYTPQAYRQHAMAQQADVNSARVYARIVSAEKSQIIALDPAKMREMLLRIDELIADFNTIALVDARQFQATLDQTGDLKSAADAWSRMLQSPATDREEYQAAAEQFTEKYIDAIYLYAAVVKANPLLDFDQLLIRKSTWTGFVPNWYSNCARGKPACQDQLIAIDPQGAISQDPELLLAAPRGGFAGDVAMHWDGNRFLFTGLSDDNSYQVFEHDIASGETHQVTPNMGPGIDNAEGCYVPDGSTLFISNATMGGIPCISGLSSVGNIFRMEADSKTVRQLTFEQDQDWYPVIQENGRIMYLRWEYHDIAHYYSRILCTMNPDGTNQTALYGSGSYWPNSMFFAKPIPGPSSRFVSVVSGHHGTQREGELYMFNPRIGDREADGAMHQFPFSDKEVEAVIEDRLVDNSWPKFAYPYPLSDKYIVVSARMTPEDQFSVYLVDTFDNMVKIQDAPGYHLLEPTPITRRQPPREIPDRTIAGETEANVFITDIYTGSGLRDVPRGTVKKLRVYTINYAYRHTGGYDVVGQESCWDCRRILGEVPVYEDGSTMFKIPANRPIILQPLDAEGRAMQLMRSWLVGMPGENVSCAGCHESQHDVTPSGMTIAMGKRPVEIEPFGGPERAFSFNGEIQPILDRYCVGCHDGKQIDADATTPGCAALNARTIVNGRIGGKSDELQSGTHRPNFADMTLGVPGYERPFGSMDPDHKTRGSWPDWLWGDTSSYYLSRSYHELHPFVRRPGPEGDLLTLTPMEFHASTSELVQMLKKGHHNVALDPQSWQTLYCWIDLNVPYYGTWTEVMDSRVENRVDQPIGDMISRRQEIERLYANINNVHEDDSYAWEEQVRPEFLPPKDRDEIEQVVPAVEHWPMTTDQAKALQQNAMRRQSLEIPLGLSTMLPISSSGMGTMQWTRTPIDEWPVDETAIDAIVILNMVPIPTGRFVMGDASGFEDERPLKVVEIEKPFWMLSTEVTNEMYAIYDPAHDSRHIDRWWIDQLDRGYPANLSRQPVVRVSREEANGFCRWLTEKTGRTFRLPTEGEWEWAARAGTASPMWYGDLDADFAPYENLADESTKLFATKHIWMDELNGLGPAPRDEPGFFAHLPRIDGVNDGYMISGDVGSYTPNPWGLYDMLGNVSEWTASDYHNRGSSTEMASVDGMLNTNVTSATVRGGSWRDRPYWGRAGVRRVYQPWQKIHNVGFRIVCEL
jgi:formylglycine-generating enzyme required for sulfatase activity